MKNQTTISDFFMINKTNSVNKVNYTQKPSENRHLTSRKAEPATVQMASAANKRKYVGNRF
jgi:hypothetical protein